MAGEAAGASRVNPSKAAGPSLAADHPACPGGEPAVTLPIGSLSSTVHDHEAVMIVPYPGAARPGTELARLLAAATAQAAAACARSQELQQRTTQMLTKSQAARQTSAQARRQRQSSPAGRDLMRQSEQARLLARLDSMPVIEQAKGIIMAQSHCGNAQAFDLLRKASQRSNVPVRELAAQIVAKTAQAPPKRVRQAARRGQVA